MTRATLNESLAQCDPEIAATISAEFQRQESTRRVDADRTYIVATAEHFTTHAHQLLAGYVRRALSSLSIGG